MTNVRICRVVGGYVLSAADHRLPCVVAKDTTLVDLSYSVSMRQLDSSADLPLAGVQVGIGVGAGWLGLLWLTALVATGTGAAGTLASAVVVAAIFGVLMWVASRNRLEFHRGNASQVTGPGRRGWRSAFWRGVTMALGLAVAESLVLGLFEWLWGGQGVHDLLPGILLGVAVWMTLDARDLRRWQQDNALAVFTRTGSSPLAFTKLQARRQHVLIPLDSAAVP